MLFVAGAGETLRKSSPEAEQTRLGGAEVAAGDAGVAEETPHPERPIPRQLPEGTLLASGSDTFLVLSSKTLRSLLSLSGRLRVLVSSGADSFKLEEFDGDFFRPVFDPKPAETAVLPQGALGFPDLPEDFAEILGRCT